MFLSSLAIACAGFLLAVLWMDLMFDVQVLGHKAAVLPEPVLASIATYYRRVTTTARPMGNAIGLVMLTLLGVLAVEIVQGRGSSWFSWVSLILCGMPIGLALGRVFPNAVRLGARRGAPELESRLARSICRDHLVCFAAIPAFIALRLTAAFGLIAR